MIYATDLDRTIIFSNKFLDKCNEDVVCVEEYNDKPISYMTSKALRKLESLKMSSNLKVIPVTTRSVAQFKRVNPMQNCEFAITSNGGTILHNGMVFNLWKDRISSILEKYQKDFKELEEYLGLFREYFEKDPKIVDNVFFFMKLKEDEVRNNELLGILDRNLDKSKWTFTLQGLKLYIIPREISKENALMFLKEYLKENKLVVSGDGKLDYGFLSIGDIRIIPQGSEVLDYITDKNFVYKSVPNGLLGTIDLFNIVNQNL